MPVKFERPKVFISHIDEDSAAAVSLKFTLEKAFANALDIFVSSDQGSIQLGKDYIAQVVQALRESSIVLILISRESVASPWIFFEAGGGLVRDADVIPICIKGMELEKLPIFLGIHHGCKLDSERELQILFRSIANTFGLNCTIEDWTYTFKSIFHARTPKYIGRIDRAKQIVKSLKEITEDVRKGKRNIHIRMRGTWTSMSNIQHYSDANLPEPFPYPEQAEELDRQLVNEKECIIELLNMEGIKLKSICWPKARYLESYYTQERKYERVDCLRDFLQKTKESPEKLACRQLVCDESAAFGNQLIIDNKIILISNSKSGGYTETSVFTDTQVIDMWIREYDNQFKRILKTKHLEENSEMLDDVLEMLGREVEKLNGQDENRGE